MEQRTQDDIVIFLDGYPPEPDAHMPVIRCKEEHFSNTTGLRTWSEWTADCVCGWKNHGIRGKWYIPSKEAAERLYNEHFMRATGQLDGELKGNREDYDNQQVMEWEML